MSRDRDDADVTAGLSAPRSTHAESRAALMLCVLDGARTLATYRLERPRVLLGSGPAADFSLTADGVAPLHCELLCDERGVRIRDLDTDGGTYVDGVRVVEAFIDHGARIGVGTSTLSLLRDGDVASHTEPRFGDLVGASEAMRAVFEVLARSASSEVTVLIEGETGTGKEGAAFAIHRASARREGPFVVVDCGAIPESLIESELFGHEKGAFTGAVQRHLGAFEQAHGGTVFLDEVGELPLDLQPKLLRVLEQKTIRRVGSGERRAVDVRIVAATNRDLRSEVQAGRFRSDLYFRLSVLKVALPPLRARTEDLGLVTTALLERLGATPAQLARFTSQSALERLSRYEWPGNVRELRNHLERCVVMDQELAVEGERTRPSRTEPSDAHARETEPAHAVDASLPYDEARQAAIAAFERSYLKALLDRHGGNVSQAAREAGIDRVYLHRLIRRHGIKG